MTFMYFVVVALIAAVDQAAKAWVAETIPLGGVVSVLPGVFHLTHLQNSGAAFSLLSGQRWFFIAMTVAFFALAIFALRHNQVTHPVGRWALASVCGGALGNLVDRVCVGYVIDMVELEFMHFAVFNVADCFLTCGVVVLLISLLFLEKKEALPHDDSSGKQR